ncbi:hypothetical protein CANARDRAFT_184795, partial [[Candida] arabinofermentans NRRL YB-2248]
MLKRKNEESENSTVKRVALDSDVVEQKDMEDDKHKTSASFNSSVDKESNDEPTDVQMNDGDNKKSGPISSHKVVHNDDPTYVHFRMLCTINETALIVGKGGDSINKIKELSAARVNVSENLKGVPERVISVRGPSENVAKAFGLIARVILEETLDQASSLESKQLNVRLLFPHTIMGYIIGKKGARFREIEDNSAAALKANDQILPSSTDRILNINGVADAIHIATYYVASTILEHKQQMTKAIYYNPANYNQSITGNNSNSGMYGQMPPPPPPGKTNGMPQHMMNPFMMSQGFQQYPMQGAQTVGSGAQYMGVPNGDGNNNNINNNGNDGEKLDFFVPQNHIGLVIGKGGKNLKDIRSQTGVYVKVNDEVPGAAERKLTLNGSTFGIQSAIMLINNRIENERARQ